MNVYSILLCVTAVAMLSACSQSSREEAIDRVSGAAKTLNGKSDTTPDIVKEQKKKERERQNRQWTMENIGAYPVEACNAKLAELEDKERKATLYYNKALSMKLSAERDKHAADAEVAKYSEWLDLAKSAWNDANASGKWPVKVNDYPFGQIALKEKITEALKKKASSETNSKQASDRMTLADSRMKEVQESRKQIASEKEQVQNIKRRVEMGEFQKNLQGLADELNGVGPRMSDLEAIGQTIGGNDTPDVFAPSTSKEDEKLFDSFMK